MASRNLELVRSIYSEWERGDWSSADWAHPEIEFVLADGPDPGSWTGLAELSRRAGDLIRTWEDFRAEVQQYRELDHDRVFVLWKASASGPAGKRGGVNPHLLGESAHIFQLHDGMVVRLAFYLEKKHALADLGLSADGEAGDALG